MEDWIPLRDYTGYSVSSFGRIRNDDRGKLLAIIRTESGHVFVGIMKDGVQVKRAVAKLVCEMFLNKPQNAEHYDTPIHLDGDLSNCNVNNLAWRPRWFAMEYAKQFRRNQPQHPPIRNRSTGEIFHDCWVLVIREGLLYRDILFSATNQTYVIPSMHIFEWV